MGSCVRYPPGTPDDMSGLFAAPHRPCGVPVARVASQPLRGKEDSTTACARQFRGQVTGARLIRAGIATTVALAAALPAAAAIAGSPATAASVHNGRIFFITRANLYSINPNGTGRRLVTRNASDPSVSGDG